MPLVASVVDWMVFVQLLGFLAMFLARVGAFCPSGILVALFCVLFSVFSSFILYISCNIKNVF